MRSAPSAKAVVRQVSNYRRNRVTRMSHDFDAEFFASLTVSSRLLLSTRTTPSIQPLGIALYVATKVFAEFLAGMTTITLGVCIGFLSRTEYRPKTLFKLLTFVKAHPA